MTSKIIREHLEALQKEKKYDEGYIQILSQGNSENQEGEDIAANMLGAIDARYVKSKKNNS